MANKINRAKSQAAVTASVRGVAGRLTRIQAITIADRASLTHAQRASFFSWLNTTGLIEAAS